MRYRVLFVPDIMPSHLISLLALAKLLDREHYEPAFLLQSYYHQFTRGFGFDVLEIDHRADRTTIQSELRACSEFEPDVIVDDLSYTTAFSSRLMKIPRISLVRKGILPFEVHKQGTRHSSGIEGIYDKIKKQELVTDGIWVPESLADLFVGDINLIPSLSSVELIPDLLKHTAKYFHVGPLLLRDEEIMRNIHLLKNPDLGDTRAAVERFLSANRNNKLVYFTAGLTNPDSICQYSAKCIAVLLSNGISVITNIPYELLLSQSDKSRLLVATILPMHRVCSTVDFMVHHCGSGTYNYQLLYGVPAIFLGSLCYDRDEIAENLEEIGAGFYIAADLPEQTYIEKFTRYVQLLKEGKIGLHRAMTEKLTQLKGQIQLAESSFDFGDIVTNTIQSYYAG